MYAMARSGIGMGIPLQHFLENTLVSRQNLKMMGGKKGTTPNVHTWTFFTKLDTFTVNSQLAPY